MKHLASIMSQFQRLFGKLSYIRFRTLLVRFLNEPAAFQGPSNHKDD